MVSEVRAVKTGGTGRRYHRNCRTGALPYSDSRVLRGGPKFVQNWLGSVRMEPPQVGVGRRLRAARRSEHPRNS